MQSPSPSEHRVEVNGIELAYFEWGAEFAGSEPTLLLAHATGFHARVWDQMISHLGQRHVISLDQRGHGRSGKSEITDWRVFGADIAAFVRTRELNGIVGIGHSMGGHAMTDAAAALPERFVRLVLIDPVIVEPEAYVTGVYAALPEGAAHPVTRRLNHFESPEAMFARFADRYPYSEFEPDALRDYCNWGLVGNAEGDGYRLACDPRTEASVYMTSRSNKTIYRSVHAVKVPVLVLRAKPVPEDRDMMDFSFSPTWPQLAGEFPSGRDLQLPEHTHFLPMEIPKTIAEHVLE